MHCEVLDAMNYLHFQPWHAYLSHSSKMCLLLQNPLLVTDKQKQMALILE